jgi:YVTN family beta-propeller protein
VIDPGKGAVVATIPVGENPGPISAGAGGIWVLNQNSATLSHIDVATRKLVETTGIGGSAGGGGVPGSVAASAQNVWLNAAGCNGQQSGAILHVVAGGGVGRNLDGGDDSRIDPKTNLVAQTVGVGHGPAAIATGAGAVWVALADAGSVARIDARTNRVTATIRVGHRPQGVVVAGGLV